jgi:hypothetical protein
MGERTDGLIIGFTCGWVAATVFFLAIGMRSV